jgi:hypothetical protein
MREIREIGDLFEKAQQVIVIQIGPCRHTVHQFRNSMILDAVLPIDGGHDRTVFDGVGNKGSDIFFVPVDDGQRLFESDQGGRAHFFERVVHDDLSIFKTRRAASVRRG